MLQIRGLQKELIRERVVIHIKGAHFWEETLSPRFKQRQFYLPFPKQKSCIRWPRYTEDEPHRAEIATGAFSQCKNSTQVGTGRTISVHKREQ